MDAQDFRSLQEAYMEVYQEQELDEELSDNTRRRAIRHIKDTKKLLKSMSREMDYDYNPEPEGYEPESDKKIKKRTQKEQVDIYDIILSHLLDEGYAETPEQAERIMVHMSEEWREGIMEGAAQKVADRAQKLANQRKGQTPERKKIYQSLANKADERANPKPEKNYRLGMSDDFRKLRALAKETEGGDKIKTTNPKKLRKQKVMGEHD